MQGQKGTVGSLPETLDFDLGSSSNSAAMDQQMCWNNVRNPPENRLPDYLLPSDMNIAFVNSMGRERQSLSRWCSNEASSSNTQNEERKLELGWPSSGPVPVPGPMLEEPASSVLPDNSANLMLAPSSNSNSIQPSLNLGFVGYSGSGSSQVPEFSHSYKFGGSENEQNQPVSGSDPFLLPSGSAGFLGADNDGRQGPVDGRRMSCKRKAIEGNVGPSSSSGSSSYFQHTDSSARPGLPARSISGSGLSIYTSSEQGTPRHGLGFPDPNVAENPETSHRNLRLRMSSSNPLNSITPSIFSSGRAVRRSSALPLQPSMNLLPVDHSLELRPMSAVGNSRSQSQPAVVDAPSLPQNPHALRWIGASTSRNGGPLSSVAFGDRDAPPRDELSSRNLPRTIPEHPIPATELRNLVRHQVRSVAGGSLNIPAHAASTSRSGSSSNVNPSPAPAWPPQHNPPQYQRRFSEYLRRSLFSSGGAESGGQMGNYLLRPGHPGSSQEMLLPSGAGNLGQQQPHHRLASWLERHNDNAHYSLRSLGAGGEGSSRLVSEQIRNVLGLIRRGESLRFEDVMILDPAIFAGVADMHDRHRDMRLDVDNMSYEELLALEERIGNVSTGLSEETISKHLKQKKYAISGKPQSEIEPCCVCQEDYNEGETIGTLECSHDFHTDCIKQWLKHKNICPICKTTALQT